MKEKFIRLLRWMLYKLDQPCPKDLKFIDDYKSNGMGIVKIEFWYETELSQQEFEIYILEKA